MRLMVCPLERLQYSKLQREMISGVTSVPCACCAGQTGSAATSLQRIQSTKLATLMDQAASFLREATSEQQRGARARARTPYQSRSLDLMVVCSRCLASLVPGRRRGVPAPRRGSRARSGSNATGRFVAAPVRSGGAEGEARRRRGREGWRSRPWPTPPAQERRASRS